MNNCKILSSVNHFSSGNNCNHFPSENNYNHFPSENILYIYSDKSREKKNVYFVRYTKKYIMDEILQINKKLRVLFYIDYEIENIELFEKFLEIIFSPYYIKRSNVYIFMCNCVVLVDKMKKLLENIEKLSINK